MMIVVDSAGYGINSENERNKGSGIPRNRAIEDAGADPTLGDGSGPSRSFFVREPTSSPMKMATTNEKKGSDMGEK